jgi:DNA recombination protein RmuC
MNDYLYLLAAFIVGGIVFYSISILINRRTQKQKDLETDYLLEKVKNAFGQLSREALSDSSNQLIKLAQAKLETERQANTNELETKKNLIDQELKNINKQLQDVSFLVKDLEKDRANKFGELSQLLEGVSQQNKDLNEVTSSLKQALSSTKTRGQWGERMAEDVLHMAGFIENINYLKQKTLNSSNLRPDFTFLLPNELKLNMDVKFPLNNYLKYVEAEAESDKAMYCNKFLLDVKARIKEVTSKDYIDPEENTVDYALLFIPNEQIYAFINEKDRSIIDEAIKNRVIICSPITLFAVLAVIRQAVDNFALEKTSNEILRLLNTFKKQWLLFVAKLEKLGDKINDAQTEYETLNSTRLRQLEKPLNQIDLLRNQKQISNDSKKEEKPED